MKFYVQTDKNNVITDVIEFAYLDYQPVEWDVPLPPKIIGRVYELVDGQPVYHPEWDTESASEVTKADIEALNAKIDYVAMMTEVL